MSSMGGTRHACDLNLILSPEGYSMTIDVPDSSRDTGEYLHTLVLVSSDMEGSLNVAVTENGSRMHRRELPAIVNRALAALEAFYQENGQYELPFNHESSPGRFIAPYIRKIPGGSHHPPRPYRVTHQGLHDYFALRNLGYDPCADFQDTARFLREHGGDPDLFTEDGILFRHPAPVFEREPFEVPAMLERSR